MISRTIINWQTGKPTVSHQFDGIICLSKGNNIWEGLRYRDGKWWGWNKERSDDPYECKGVIAWASKEHITHEEAE